MNLKTETNEKIKSEGDDREVRTEQRNSSKVAMAIHSFLAS